MSKELTEFEREVYEFIRKHGTLLTTNIPAKMRGAVPNLKNKGLVEVFKRRTSLWSSKKRKFVKARKLDQSELELQASRRGETL